jgi:hypothetical protein
MTGDEHTKYWLPAKVFIQDRFRMPHDFHNNFDVSRKLSSLLGISYPEITYWRQFDLTVNMGKLCLRPCLLTMRTEPMTVDEFRIYWLPIRNAFVENGFEGRILTASHKIAALLGFEYTGPNCWENIPLTDDVRHQLLMLASPHWKTIVKIMEVNKGHHDDL